MFTLHLILDLTLVTISRCLPFKWVYLFLFTIGNGVSGSRIYGEIRCFVSGFEDTYAPFGPNNNVTGRKHSKLTLYVQISLL